MAVGCTRPLTIRSSEDKVVAVVDMTRVRPLEQDMILLVQASHLSAATADRLAAAPED